MGFELVYNSLKAILHVFGPYYVSSATHDNNDTVDAPKCHPGTRVSFLTRLSNWAKDIESSVHVTWLHGPAGAGKSAIARSLAQSLHRERLLAGSFFFFRTDPRRNSEKQFVTTLAYQIALSIPETKPYIAKAVQDDPTVCDRSLQTQFEKLIIQPLVQITASGSPMLIIVDGLDECIVQKEREDTLEVIFDALPRLHGHVKFLIVSRPEYDIQRSFDFVATSIGQHINTIGLQGDLQAYEDVRIYLNDNFRRIKQTHPLQEHFTPDWPSGDAIERLVEKSSGHFIYASTVVKYIENDFDEPRKRLDIVINLRTTSCNPYAELDALYLNILSSSRADHTLLVNIFSLALLADVSSIKLDEFWKWQRGIIMKSDRFVDSVLTLKPEKLQLAVLDLKSLVGVSSPQGYPIIKTIEFFHKSFSDFLCDPSRSKRFHASAANGSMLIANSCLRLLSDNTGLLERCFATTNFGSFIQLITFFFTDCWPCSVLILIRDEHVTCSSAFVVTIPLPISSCRPP